jgi:hypothetical protein
MPKRDRFRRSVASAVTANETGGRGVVAPAGQVPDDACRVWAMVQPDSVVMSDDAGAFALSQLTRGTYTVGRAPRCG